MSGTTIGKPVSRQGGPRRSGWNLFPVWLFIAMGLVVAVNARFITLAVTTFPGAAVLDDFDTSNDYNRILSGVDRQNALGWRVKADNAGDLPAIVLTGRDGQPLPAAAVQGMARHPIGNEPDVAVTLNQTGAGRFTLATPLHQGQWDLLLQIKADGHDMRVTRRVLVR